jgi:hypothetical protein
MKSTDTITAVRAAVDTVHRERARGGVGGVEAEGGDDDLRVRVVAELVRVLLVVAR